MDKSSLNVSPVLRAWALILPFLIWLGFHHWGAISPRVDNSWYSYWITYHFDYIARGIFPLWDPFRAWGWPDLTDPRFFGDLNPLYLIISFLVLLHVPAFAAFNVFLVVFYLLGGIGFYLFVKCFWDSELAALLAYAMYMFSTLGGLLFSQLTVISMLIASIWFYYFLTAFLKAGPAQEQKKYFVGLVFALMITVSTYVPFFFLVSMSAVAAATLLVSPASFISIFRKIVVFARTFPFLFVTGMAALVMACLPGLIWYLSLRRGDIVFLTERNDFGALNFVSVASDMVSHSGLAVQSSLGEIFSDSDFVLNSFCYVPIFLVIILSLGLFTRMEKCSRILFTGTFFIFLFALAGVTPLQPFLYKHVVFFRSFRNLYFLGPLLLMGMIALGVGQLALFLKAKPEGRWGRAWYLFYILLVHAGWLIFLTTQERVLWTSYATLIGSAILFSLYFSEFFHRRGFLFLMGLMVLALLGPGQIIARYWNVWGVGKVNTETIENGAFAYTRPLRGEDPQTQRGFGLSPKKRQDESGFFQNGYYGSRYSFLLYSNVPKDDLEKYVSYKFIIYDKVSYMDGDHLNWTALSQSLSTIQPPAWVHEREALHSSPPAKTAGQASAVSGPSDLIRVIDFGPNEVKIMTNFPRPKFLVYNDSYCPGWMVFINGQRQPLYRANVAFKGTWVDAGRQNVEFRFDKNAQYFFYWALVFLFAIWGGYVVLLFIKENNALR